MTIECEAAMSQQVLQAARIAISDFTTGSNHWLPGALQINQLPEKQRPLMPLLMALLDSAEAVAKAVDDNAWDDGAAIDRTHAESLANQCYRVGAAITSASNAHNVNNWSLPSMSGKELV